MKSLEIVKNEILKNNGCGIKLFEIQSFKNDPNKIVIKENQVSESYIGGAGIFIENCSVSLISNDIRKNR